MNIHLGETWTSYIETLVATGEYQNNSEVIREALRLFKENQTLRQAKLTELKKAIRAGLIPLDQGQGMEVDSKTQLAQFKERSKRKARS